MNVRKQKYFMRLPYNNTNIYMINIFLKELKTHLIDWRFWSRLFLAFLIPYLLFSYVWYLTNQVIEQKFAQPNPVAKVAAIGLAKESPLYQQLSLDSHLEWIEAVQVTDIDSLILKDSLQLVVVFPEAFDSLLIQGKQAQLQLHYHQNQSGAAVDKVLTKIDAFEAQLISQKNQKLGLSESISNPIIIESYDLFNLLDGISEAVNFAMLTIEKSLAAVLTILCWLFLLLLVGYCSLSSFALAKEYKTLSPLLSSNPISALIWGKILWISIAGILGVSLALLGVLWSLDTGQEGWIATITEHLGDFLQTTVLLKIILWVWAMAWLVASILSSISLHSLSTYKASKWMFYVQMFLFLLVILGVLTIPTLSVGTAFLPILNTTALFKGLLTGTLSTGLFIVAVGVPILLGGLIGWRLSLSSQSDD